MAIKLGIRIGIIGTADQIYGADIIVSTEAVFTVGKQLQMRECFVLDAFLFFVSSIRPNVLYGTYSPVGSAVKRIFNSKMECGGGAIDEFVPGFFVDKY